MTDDLLESARLACESYFIGEIKAKRPIRFDMEALRAVVNAELKRRAQDETHRIPSQGEAK